MKLKWSDLLPNSDCVENLEYLQTKVLQVRKSFVRPGEQWGAYGLEALFTEVKIFEKLVQEKEDMLGPERVTRILLNNVPSILSAADLNPPNQRRAHEWTGRVLDNIEQELKRIVDARMLWITLISAVIAVILALVTTIAFVWDIVKTRFGC
jgi:hypothetical protein